MVHKVVPQVVHDDHGLQVSVQQIQVLDEDLALRQRVVPVQSVGNQLLRVNLVENPVGIRLGARCEDYQFEHLSHLIDEAESVGSHGVIASVVVLLGRKVAKSRSLIRTEVCKMDQCFVQI